MELGRIVDTAREVHFRGKARMAKWLVPRTGQKITRVFGSVLPLDLRNHIDWLIYSGCFEPLNTHRFHRLLDSAMTVVDVGANIGYFSLLSARIVGPSGHVIAVEPEPTNRAILSEAVERNGLRHVTVIAEALGDRPGTGSLHQADQVTYPNRTASMASDASDGQRFEVRVRTLDELLVSLRVNHVDLLKIDVDGFEWQILQGASESLASGKIAHVIVECEPFWLQKAGTSKQAIADYLWRFGLFEQRSPLTSALLGPCIDALFSRR